MSSESSSPINQSKWTDNSVSVPTVQSLEKVTKDISPMLSSTQSKSTCDSSARDSLGRSSVPKETIHHHPTHSSPPYQTDQGQTCESYEILDVSSAAAAGVTFCLDNGDTVCTLEDDPGDTNGGPPIYSHEPSSYSDDPLYSNNNIFPATAYLPPLTSAVGSTVTTAVTTTSVCSSTRMTSSLSSLPSSHSRATPPNEFPFESKSNATRLEPGCLNPLSVQPQHASKSSSSVLSGDEDQTLGHGPVSCDDLTQVKSTKGETTRAQSSRSDSESYLHSIMTDEFRDIILSLLPQLSIAKMDPASQQFCLRWNNHRSNLLTVFDHLLQTEAFCDVTIACDGASLKCHKIILSACSSYFQTLFTENVCDHPIVFLKDIKYDDIRAILDYMYKGEVNVAQDQLPGLLKVAELLKVKGLVEERLKEGRSDVTTSDDHRERSSSTSKANNNRDSSRDARDRSNERPASVNGKDSSPPTPTSLPAGGPGGFIRNIMGTPPAGAPQFPMWPLPGIFPPGAAHGLFGNNGNMDRDRDLNGPNGNDKEDTPSPKEGSAKRKKTSSGSGGSTSSKEGGSSSGNGSGGLLSLRDRAELMIDGGSHASPSEAEKMMMESENGLMGLPPGMDKNSIANYVPNQQRLEWKRYKQYTRNDIMAAIEEVKKGMSALQASRKYGVPSRTLYDKVKKMGIVTGRQMQRKSLPQYPASFPSLGGMMNMDAYKDMAERNSHKDMDENTNDSLSQPGSDVRDNLDSRATLVPPMPGGAGFPSLQMLNLMEKMKDERSKGNNSEISLTPMNLSTMLSNAGARDISHMSSVFAQAAAERERERRESSLSPPQRRDEDDDVDVDDADDARRRDVDRGDHGDAAGEADSSGRDRHPSADIRAQFMADLKRLGGNIPAAIIPQNFRGNGSTQEEAASSTTSPPPAAAATSSSSLSPPSSASTTTASINLSKKSPSEESLPPRKRKVSQEQHSGFNGHADDGHNSANNSNVSSPEKVSRGGNQSPIPEANEVEPMN